MAINDEMKRKLAGRCLSSGDVLCDEDTGSVYIFKRWDTMGRLVVWDSHGGIEVFATPPENLWRYERDELVSKLRRPKAD